MNTYVKMVQLHFKGGISPEFLADIHREELMGYEHETHCEPITFSNPYSAVMAIIDCEKRSISIAKKYGAIGIRGKKARVIDIETQEIWASITAAANANNQNRSNLTKMLKGERDNRTSLRIL